MKKNYTIGLDIGTNSVGWAVVNDKNDLVKRRMKINGDSDRAYIKKNFWGVRLFEEGQTAESRRLKRTTRRRYTRRRNRLLVLQDIFREEMNQVDKSFFYRLDESFLVPEEKEYVRYPLFGTIEEEKDYYDTYQTIYHLRKSLIDSEDKKDIRLIYLAIAHIVKYRGHFLIEGTLSTENSSIEETFKQFITVYNQTFLINEPPLDEKVTYSDDLFVGPYSRSKKVEKVLELFPNERMNGTFAQFIKLIMGNQGNFKKTFELEEDMKLQFSKEDYDDLVETLLGDVGDEYSDVFVACKRVFEAVELSGILKNEDPTTNAKFSASMVERYVNHKDDLKELKLFYRDNLPDQYVSMFKDIKQNGYAGYIDGKVTQETFYKFIKKQIEGIDGAEYFINKIEQENFLRKQRTFDNGVIPHQIHLEELQKIIKNQEIYYPFLKENKQLIEQLVTFRIPYYVGPLAKNQSEFSWLIRRNNDKITPQNIERVVDIRESATAFIERMTNVDSYLPQEKVLPKNSLIYQKFMIFNELTKVSYINDQGIKCNFSSTEKSQIFTHLFLVERRVSKKALENFLKNEYLIENPTIEGIEKSFNASFSTYHDLVKIGVDGDDLVNPDNTRMFEDIIKILTIFEDRQMIRKKLEVYKEFFSTDTLKKMERRHYTGWGRLSEKLIDGIQEKHSGKTILDYLMDDDQLPKNINRNFMQLINDSELSFKEEIEAQQLQNKDIPMEQLVHELTGSPAIKKGILQSIKIVDELVSIMGYEPESIVIEMARENQNTGYGLNKSKPRLKSLELAIKNLESDLLKRYPTTNQFLRDDRLYLYYLQNGKDLYTGKELDINFLSQYDIDHIIPRSFTTDNSLDNRVLVSSSMNRGKADDVPSIEVVNKQIGLWTSLYNSNLMSKRKFDNLTKAQTGGLTLEDKERFIKRQLVETRQITKHVAQILDNQYNTETDKDGKLIRTVKIVTLKSSLVSEFRQSFGLYKVRDVNDYHHAHDAYLNAVVSNSLLNIYPNLAPEFVYGEYHKGNLFKERKATAKKQFYTNIMRFFASKERIMNEETGEILWDQKDVANIKKVMDYRQMNIVKKVEVQTGGFSKQTLEPKGKSDKLIPIKNGLSPERYGGFGSPVIAYTVAVQHKKGKNEKLVTELIGISIMNQTTFEREPVSYLKALGYNESTVKYTFPKYSLFELENGRRRLLASHIELQKGNQMVLPAYLNTLLYHANKCAANNSTSIDYVTKHRHQFDDVMTYIKEFAERYTLADKNLATVIKLYEENQDADIMTLSSSFIELLKLNKNGASSKFDFFNTKISGKRYQSTKELLEGKIVYQSITGLYETYRNV